MNLDWQLISYMIFYMFQCHSPKYFSLDSAQFSHSVMSNSLQPHGLQHTSFPCFTVHHQLLEHIQLMSIKSVMPSIHLILCCPFLLPTSIIPSIRVFSNEAAHCIRWPKYWSFNFSISPSNEYSGLISFRIGWFDLLADQGTLKSPQAPQFKSISSSALNLVYGPALTSMHDYWKNHSFDYMELCQQSNVSF